MKKGLSMASVALALVLSGVATPRPAVAATASVCQFYRGEPLCKTVSEQYCAGVSAGLEGQVCRTTTEYWYWS